MRLVDSPGQPHSGAGPVTAAEASARTFILMAPMCGLSVFTEAFFRSAGLPLKEHPDRAASYRELEDRVALGLGSAILPESKVTRQDLVGHDLVGPDGNPVVMRYRAYWRDDCPMAQLIEEITRSLGAE